MSAPLVLIMAGHGGLHLILEFLERLSLQAPLACRAIRAARVATPHRSHHLLVLIRVLLVLGRCLY